MKNILLFALAAVALVGFKQDSQSFEGKIIYKNTFTNLDGRNIGAQLAPYFGYRVEYYINSANYKGVADNHLFYLYNSASSTYYYFNKNNQSATRYDVTVKSKEQPTVTKLPNKELVAGYKCDMIRIENGKTITTYFFTPAIKVDYKNFLNHEFGAWNTYLKATGGALPLKFILKNLEAGYILTNEATEVTRMKLEDKDFQFPSNYTIR
jgi:hypothetical protein